MDEPFGSFYHCYKIKVELNLTFIKIVLLNIWMYAFFLIVEPNFKLKTWIDYTHVWQNIVKVTIFKII